MNYSSHLPAIEPLESRIAPAALNGNVLTYQEGDGDKVKVTFSLGAGVLTTSSFTFDDPNAFTNNAGVQLQTINLGGNTALNGLSISFKITKAAGGDGRANVGFINGNGVDLKDVSVKGDLGRIEAGDTSTSTLALRSLKVRSIGAVGLITQASGGNLESNINGSLGQLVVSHDIIAAAINLLPSTPGDGDIGSVKIGGSLIGGGATSEGLIQVNGKIGSVSIRNDIVGGAGVGAGAITADETIGKITIGGSVMAGVAGSGGSILGKLGLGAVKIGGDLQGGTQGNSGFLRTFGSIKSLTVNGSILGGDGASSGAVLATQNIGPVKIKGDLTGAAGPSSGTIEADLSMGSVKIGGDATAGGVGSKSGIFAGVKMGAVKIKGDLAGNASGAFTISAAGADTVVPGATQNLAIAGLKVGGDVIGARILAGFDVLGFGVNGHVQIGAVKVKGDWTASTISAGVFNKGADHVAGGTDDNLNFGDADDEQITNGPATIIAKIASITIKGTIAGTAAAGDHFGFVSEQVVSFKANGAVVPRTAATDPAVNFSAGTALDVTLHEV